MTDPSVRVLVEALEAVKCEVCGGTPSYVEREDETGEVTADWECPECFETATPGKNQDAQRALAAYRSQPPMLDGPMGDERRAPIDGFGGEKDEMPNDSTVTTVRPKAEGATREMCSFCGGDFRRCSCALSASSGQEGAKRREGDK